MKRLSTCLHQHVLQPQHSLLFKGGEGWCVNKGLRCVLKLCHTQCEAQILLVNVAIQTQILCLSRAFTLTLWFHYSCGLEIKKSLSTLVCLIHFQERSMKCLGCFKRGQECVSLGSDLACINRRNTS